MLTDGECQEGWKCRSREDCPEFQAEQESLKSLISYSAEWLKLVSKLRNLVCNKEEKRVCCKKDKMADGGDLQTA